MYVLWVANDKPHPFDVMLVPISTHCVPCRQIHKYMSGRIKLLRNGVPVSESDDPELGYEYDAPGTFDEGCGTYGLDAYQLPHRQCPDTYVCGLNESDTSTTNPSSGLQSYARCTNAMNCRMFAGMTTGVTAASPTALFIHQVRRPTCSPQPGSSQRSLSFSF